MFSRGKFFMDQFAENLCSRKNNFSPFVKINFRKGQFAKNNALKKKVALKFVKVNAKNFANFSLSRELAKNCTVKVFLRLRCSGLI